jgi:hypothetical protein
VSLGIYLVKIPWSYGYIAVNKILVR